MYLLQRTNGSLIKEHHRVALNGKIPVVRCPIEDCEYRTPDVDPVVAAALITTRATVHGLPHSATSVAKAEKVKRPCISSAGTTEDWQYFTSRWTDYVEATKL